MRNLHTDKQPPGRVRDAIIRYLRSREQPASVSEIWSAVAAELGHDNLAQSSVRSYLRLNIGTFFDRPTRGMYCLHRVSAVRVPKVEPNSRLTGQSPAFRFGHCELFVADCVQWLSVQAENSIHGVVTDPPYGLVEYSDEEQLKLQSGRGGVWRIPPSFDGHRRSPLPRFTTLSDDDLRGLESFFRSWSLALLRVVVPGGHVVVASNPLLSYRVACAMAEAGFERRGEIVRLVMTMRGGDRPKNAHLEFPDVSVMPRSMWEPWLVFRKPLQGRVQDNLRKWGTGGFRRISSDQPFGDVIKSHPTRREERAIAPHPSLKPQSFLRQVVRAILPLGQGVVLDPFAGSGSTLAAAEFVGYRSIGIELNPRYAAVAKKAIPRLTRLGLEEDTPTLFSVS